MFFLPPTRLALSAEEVARLEEAYRPHPVLGHGYQSPTGFPPHHPPPPR